MSMISSIVVPLDGSAAAERALPAAAALARATNATVRLLHVVDEAEGPRLSPEASRAEELFREYAGERCATLGLDPGATPVEVRFGSAASEILAAAEGASCIVLASHGRGGFHATFIGSVADKVVRGAELPVLVVPAVEQPVTSFQGKPIIVPLDGSEASAAALPFARELASLFDSKVTLLQTYTLVAASAAFGMAYYATVDPATLEEAAMAYLREVAREGEEIVAMLGPASTAIVTVAEERDAGMVVMATGGKGLAKRLILGSTTDRVLHSIRRPLFIIRPPH